MKVEGGNSGRRANQQVREAGLEKMKKMEVDEEVKSKNKFVQRKKKLVQPLRKINECPDKPQSVVDVLKGAARY